MQTLTIRSSDSSATIEFHRSEPDHFQVTFRNSSVTASNKAVDLSDCAILVDQFKWMAANWKGWVGSTDWVSLEGDMHVQCSHDKLGHVGLKLTLRSPLPSEDWHVVGYLKIEAGQLESLADQLGQFFQG
jgi:hypothetical protein